MMKVGTDNGRKIGFKFPTYFERFWGNHILPFIHFHAKCLPKKNIENRI